MVVRCSLKQSNKTLEGKGPPGRYGAEENDEIIDMEGHVMVRTEFDMGVYFMIAQTRNIRREV